MKKTKIIYKTRPKTLAKLKKDLRTVLHRYVRMRDCPDGYAQCISCPKVFPFSELEAGHFIPSTYTAVRFEESNIHAQCKGCNNYKSANLIEYRPRLIQKIGEEAVEELEARRHDTFKQTRDWYEEKIAYYKSLTKQNG